MYNHGCTTVRQGCFLFLRNAHGRAWLRGWPDSRDENTAFNLSRRPLGPLQTLFWPVLQAHFQKGGAFLPGLTRCASPTGTGVYIQHIAVVVASRPWKGCACLFGLQEQSSVSSAQTFFRWLISSSSSPVQNCIHWELWILFCSHMHLSSCLTRPHPEPLAKPGRKKKEKLLWLRTILVITPTITLRVS